MNELLKKNRTTIAAVVCFCLMLITLLWIRLHHQLKNDRKETIAAAIQRNENLAVALEQYAIRTIHNADAVLQMIKREYESNTSATNIKKTLDSNSVDRVFYVGVAIADERGALVLADFNVRNTSPNVADRKHFTVHKNNPALGLFIGQPIVSRTLGKAIIPFTRRINKRDGTFGGTVGVQVEPATFTRFYAKANLRPNDIISLVDPNGITYSRRTGSVDGYGEDISKSPLFRHLATQPVGSYFSKDAIRGIPSYFSYRKLTNYPMIATVGVAEEDVLAEYRQRARRDYFSLTVISLLIALFCVLVCLILLLRKKHLNRVKYSERKYRSIFENSHDAIMLARPDGQMLAANPAAQKIFCMSEEGICGKKLCQLADANDPGFPEFFTGGKLATVANRELRFLRGDGGSFVGEMASAYFEDSFKKEACILIIRDITDRKKMELQLLMEQKRYQRMLTKQVIHAQEREREEIGRELHDNVNQVLTTVKLYLDTAMNQKEMREELLPKSIGYLQQSINEIRNLSRDLTAPTLGTRSLVDSINALLEMVQGSSGIRICFQYDEYSHSLVMDQKLAIYRMVQEQLNNIVKHAKASEVHISLSQANHHSVLTIRDNGQGFNKTERGNGIGLNNITSRAKVFDGDVHIDTEPGKGCMLTVILPMAGC